MKPPLLSRRGVLASAAALVGSRSQAAHGKTAPHTFPKDFVWGAATSAYQVEGAVAADGRGPSIWDMFVRKPDAVFRGQRGDVAADHYNRFKGDVGLMKQIGLQAYRYSISWSRVCPNGRVPANASGLDFYDRLTDALLTASIVPYVTLYHWDMPLALYRQGGWLNRDSASWFAEYTEAVVARLSDRVKHWMTLNEPQVFIPLGHLEGKHAPGDKLAIGEVVQVAHNVLRAHGKAALAIRASSKTKPTVGIAAASWIKVPATGKASDIEATRKSFFSVAKNEIQAATWQCDPLFRGAYPDDGLALFGKHLPPSFENDLQEVKQPLDFLGLNLYFGAYFRQAKEGHVEYVNFPDGFPTNQLDWQIVPEVLYWGPKFFYDRYKTPIIITENGMPNLDWVSEDGAVHDPQRVDFINRYLKQLALARRDGVDVRGYFHWSLLDNFEWAEGYKARFGLIHVDYATQKRTLKDSAKHYAKIISTRGALVAPPG